MFRILTRGTDTNGDNGVLEFSVLPQVKLHSTPYSVCVHLGWQEVVVYSENLLRVFLFIGLTSDVSEIIDSV